MTRDLVKTTDEAVLSSVPLPELDHEIRRCLLGYQTGGTSQGRKAYFDRLVWLEKVRESAHNIEAKRRRFGR